MNMNLHPMALHSKVAAGTLAGALTTIIISELARRGIAISPEESAGITVILSSLAGWLTPSVPQPPA
jgi:hypothetical protein